MEMEDHSHSNQFGIDIRQFISGRPTHFPLTPQPLQPPQDLFSAHRNHHHHHQQLQPPQASQSHYDMMMLMPRDSGLQEFRSGSSSNACLNAPLHSTAGASANSGSNPVKASVITPTLGGLEVEAGGSYGGDVGTGRWPRQETLTLLEIRSRLDSKFKEANQKGPLWDEVSRIMSEEHGYQRSGKKCREKFENLYKYYKKTKEGKAGRQDGKHYRFFRQLEALYGESSNPVSAPETHFGNSLGFPITTNSSSQANQEAFPSQRLCDSLSLSSSSEFDTTSSEDNDLSTATIAENDSSEKRRKGRGRRSWKAKIKEFIDSQMIKLMERQEAWLEKLTTTLEQKEQERMIREEEWRKQEAARIDREHKFWAEERAWIEARDAAIMESLKKLTGREVNVSSPEELVGAEVQNHSDNQNDNGSETINNSTIKGDFWPESEITRLVQLRTSMEPKFQRSGCPEEVLWEEIAGKMACFGYERSALMCKDKWDIVNSSRWKNKACNRKRKENSRSCCYFPSNESIYNPENAYCEISEQGPETVRIHPNDGSPPTNSNAGNVVSDSCFRFLMSDGSENMWENYGLKLTKGDQN
ncbi:hypothetical protein K2173_018542 [Erythroxylum novogranatense]|uniref:Myb-like domain-containing protein n=1 Tax=Erythroxylum novogranatense TaxID=1862640 RepID=A0AAV8UAZ8_9ROSI|nr:hypothetical protein K2173_018542 [Erythroxylum novogranatense]